MNQIVGDSESDKDKIVANLKRIQILKSKSDSDKSLILIKVRFWSFLIKVVHFRNFTIKIDLFLIKMSKYVKKYDWTIEINQKLLELIDVFQQFLIKLTNFEQFWLLFLDFNIVAAVLINFMISWSFWFQRQIQMFFKIKIMI